PHQAITETARARDAAAMLQGCRTQQVLRTGRAAGRIAGTTGQQKPHQERARENEPRCPSAWPFGLHPGECSPTARRTTIFDRPGCFAANSPAFCEDPANVGLATTWAG